MDGLEAALRREPNVLRAVRMVKNRLPDTQANRNHMNVVLACSRRQRPSSLAEPHAIQSDGRALGLISPQLTTRSLAARTIAPMKVKRTAMPSSGSCISGLSRAETKKPRRPMIQTIQQTIATNMIKLTAAVAEPAASMFDEITLPVRAVRRRVISSPVPRNII